ncbi:hypothetical protein WN71_009755 [Streptomyces mangrovisoli]|uniref:A-factor biosynthesis hotdog domain-containing protein n=1 Tax=Streptomyces mangrovisoli TaxID=1428628 RepID=A0A1J4P3V0_9ACTN|nr:hypothetical protein WN71_009755 [Streptomyces mangrovisoli]
MPAAAPRLTTTVPREYVHRSSHAEVFLTSCERTGEHQFTLTGQWPRAHTFFTSHDGLRHDPLQAAETIRQTGLLIAHTHFGVPLGNHFLLWDLHISTHPEQMVIGATPSELELTATVTDLVRRGRHQTEFTLDITITRQGRPCASGGGRFTCLAPGTYRRLRGAGEPAKEPAAGTHHQHPWPLTTPPHTVGRHRPFDVVLAPTHQPHRWLLNPDPHHPVLYDHHGDHHPGMVLLEAARQAATALIHPTPHTITGATADFHHYAELGTPCWIQATLPPTHTAHHPTIHITAHQNHHIVFTALVTAALRPPAAASRTV